MVFNPRRAGKKALVALDWGVEFRQDRGKRGCIERFFALLRRYYRLNRLQRTGLWAAYRHACGVCFMALLVTWLADHLGHPDLIQARSLLLAPC